MGRNKDAEPLTKRERKLKEPINHLEGDQSRREGERGHVPCAGRELTRRPVQTSNNSNWLHAVGFVVLAAIVISWALGY